MKTLLNIIVTFIVFPWGGLVIMSPMMIAAKDFATSKSSITTAMLFFLYPVFVFLFLKLIGQLFYGTNPLWWAASFLAMGMLIIYAYGLPRQFYNVSNGISNYDYFIKDGKVYLNGKQIKGADADTFTNFDDRGYYSKDKNNVYYEHKKLANADAATFKPLANDSFHAYWHDKNYAYYRWDKINGADGASFESLGLGYTKDKNNVYLNNERVDKADPKTFTPLKMYVGRDKDNVFVRSVIVNDIADKDTFEIIEIEGTELGRDKHHIYAIFYVDDHPIVPFPNVDKDTFELLGDHYAKDKNQVYYFSYHINKILVLEEANAETFRVEYDNTRYTNATDGTNYYKSGVLYTENEK